MSARQSSLIGFVAALLFGAGLGVSGMTRPDKVRAFLDVGGAWDPSLLFVMGGAVAVHVWFAWPRARRAAATTPPARIDAPLVTGAALFGVGWGLSGYCPGPALVSIAGLAPGTLVFVACMLVGLVGGGFAKARWGGASVVRPGDG